MANKVILILIDGMRPDGMAACGHPFVEKLQAVSSYSPEARTVYPPVTLPCHMSLFHSVAPDRHGILTNTYIPQVRPVDGLFEQLDRCGKKSAMFYNWEELRDIARPGHLHESVYLRLDRQERTDERLTEAAIACCQKRKPDFLFLYLGETDDAGHASGWMSGEYFDAIRIAFSCVEKVYDAIDADTTLIVTADHGGHGRMHGEDIPEDMTIPAFFHGKCFAQASLLPNVTILDFAPTIADLLDVPAVREWEGNSRVEK